MCEVEACLSSRGGLFDAVRLWDVAGRCCLMRYVGHNYPVHCVDAWYERKYFLTSNIEMRMFLSRLMSGIGKDIRPVKLY